MSLFVCLFVWVDAFHKERKVGIPLEIWPHVLEHSSFERKISVNENLLGLRRCFWHYWTKLVLHRIIFLSIEHPPLSPSTIVPNPRSKKWSIWKMNTTFNLKTFKILKLSCLVKKIFSLKKNRTLVFVFFHICNHNPKNRKRCCDYRYEKRQITVFNFFSSQTFFWPSMKVSWF
jgi:hypothetical protein